MAITRKDLRLRIGSRAYLGDTFTNASASQELHRMWPPEDKNEAINEAIRLSGMRWPRHVEDTSLSFASQTYTYSLSGLAVPLDEEFLLDEVHYDTGSTISSYPYAIYDDDYWTIRKNGSTYTLQVQDVPRIGATIRLIYRVRPSVLSDDVTALNPNDTAFANYIVSKASALLARNPLGAVSDDAVNYYLNRAEQFDTEAERLLSRDRSQLRKGKMRFSGSADDEAQSLYPLDYGL